jgi:hypothetical protein
LSGADEVSVIQETLDINGTLKPLFQR